MDFPNIPIRKGGTGATTAAAAVTALGLGDAFLGVNSILSNLSFTQADGTTESIGLDIITFHGYGHGLFQGGDTFLSTPGGTAFNCDDYVVDDTFYLYRGHKALTGVQPNNISTKTGFPLSRF